MIIFIAERQQYLDHIIPIYNNYIGSKLIMIDKELIHSIDKYIEFNWEDERSMCEIYDRIDERPSMFFVAAHSTLRLASVMDVSVGCIYMDHGCGQTLDIDHHFWSRINSKSPFVNTMQIFAAPNKIVMETTENNNPNVVSVLCGTPKMDKYHNVNMREKTIADGLVVFSWHWECKACPETLGGFEYWKERVAIASERFNVAIHGHPRVQDKTRRFAMDNEIEFIRDFDEVMDRAYLYVCDMSSTIYEFAATDRPVLVLNNPWFRREVNHGMRFWEFSDVGVQCNNKSDLDYCIDAALCDMDQFSSRRREISKTMYPFMGRSVGRYINLLESIEKMGRTK